eukprot:CAMPEP_0113664740 /NCGR_PEP_ID=MMETSP0038_2-20120614/1909_1 /TAXON_ID=2898 /ORGANISM="Cryptomonas paramecium" /LENGTH=93 /DNA_ID=CAMNT_0000579999 /DNA_START=172 /DNA_END=453 /DNA_ORIENTATION=- /assembly_acc=CAM_ASM_000170
MDAACMEPSRRPGLSAAAQGSCFCGRMCPRGVQNCALPIRAFRRNAAGQAGSGPLHFGPTLRSWGGFFGTAVLIPAVLARGRLGVFLAWTATF